MSNKYPKAPLVEAIFELKWKLLDNRNGMPVDNNYTLLIGSLQSKLNEKYPFHDTLPTINLPEEIAKWVVQHQFRKEKNSWPLYQIGPGILTFNETQGYYWPNFSNDLKEVVSTFFEKYPDINKLIIHDVSLRYLDVLNFDFSTNVLDFFSKELGIKFELPPDIFGEIVTKKTPINPDFRIVYPTDDSLNETGIRISRGNANGGNSLMFEFFISSVQNSSLKDKEDIFKWVDASHEITSKWFKIVFKQKIERGDFN